MILKTLAILFKYEKKNTTYFKLNAYSQFTYISRILTDIYYMYKSSSFNNRI